MKKKENKKLTFSIIAVLLLIAIIGGSTYAYWSWQTATDQQTLVDVTVRGGTLTIVGANVTNTSTNSGTQASYSLYPTNVAVNGCNPSSNPAVLKGSATVTATNQTGTPMLVTLLLKGTLTKTQGTLTTSNKGFLKWAVVETTTGIATAAATSATACVNAAVVSASGSFSSVGSNTDLTTGITWTAYKNNETTSHPELTITTDATNGNTATTKRTYDVYVWLDSGYTFTNTGNSVTDPMQDLAVTLTWSTNSTMAQVAG